MIDYEIETVKENINRIIVRDGDKIINVAERYDCRDQRTAKIALFGLACTRRLSIDNANVDRFLFL